MKVGHVVWEVDFVPKQKEHLVVFMLPYLDWVRSFECDGGKGVQHISDCGQWCRAEVL